MREILFKAKRLDNGEWVEGNLIHCEDVDENCKAIIIPKTDAEMYEGIEGVYEDDLGFEKWYKVDPTTLCQYTGLTDKNGRKIWENDIITITLECDDYLNLSETGVVEYSYGQYELKVKTPDGQNAYSNLINKLSEAPFEIEKLGNIFDNPELLEE